LGSAIPLGFLVADGVDRVQLHRFLMPLVLVHPLEVHAQELLGGTIVPQDVDGCRSVLL
jgi:hypothetical protein